MQYQSPIDLHSHSTASDGALSPTELVQLAVNNNVNTLALTDHDSVSGLAEAQTVASQFNINIINGIEFSTRWDNKTVHIVGLNIASDNEALVEATHHLNQLREERAINIGQKLAKVGIHNAYENAKQLAGSGTVTRQHFAQFLIQNGNAKSFTDVFKRYLVKSKPGYVSVNWPSLEEIINTINNAGGVAVIAHPLRYKMTATKLRQLITEFKALNGKGIEVVTGNNDVNEITTVSHYAKQYDIAASVGSDYHSDKSPWSKLGNLAPLPDGLKPVWDYF